MPRKPGLTPKQIRFIDEYLIDLNATQACIRAGYSARTAGWIGPQLLGKTHVASEIEAAIQRRSKETRIDSAWVLKRLAEIAEADISDIVDAELGTYKPIKEWPCVWRRMLTGLEVHDILTGRGDDREQTGRIIKARYTDRLKALELIGQHVKVGAFKETVKHTGKVVLEVKYGDDD